ncbi:MAG: hypothetical protein WAR37_00570 [Candidatus Microsaccharimonas sp.]
MIFFVKATEAPHPKTKESAQVAILYAGILVVFSLAQLFTFEEFTQIILSYNLPFSQTVNFALGPLVIACEVFAVPYLLRMRLSVAFRWLSMVLGWIVPTFWIFTSVWLVSTNTSASTVAFVGSLGQLTPGYWAIAVSLALAIVAAWSSWGLWPKKQYEQGHSQS